MRCQYCEYETLSWRDQPCGCEDKVGTTVVWRVVGCDTNRMADDGVDFDDADLLDYEMAASELALRGVSIREAFRLSRRHGRVPVFEEVDARCGAVVEVRYDDPSEGGER